jgi:hypothetical protein
MTQTKTEINLKEMEHFLDTLIEKDYYCHSCSGKQTIHITKTDFLRLLGDKLT